MSMHQALDSSELGSSSITPPGRLTIKEKQALIWCSLGKTSWEIAKIQNCSEATINFHFSNIRRKFNVGSRHAALLKAMELGVIAVERIDPRGAHESD